MLLGVLATLLALGLVALGLHQRGTHVLDHALAWMLARHGKRLRLECRHKPANMVTYVIPKA
jgi:hypothetical protein